MISIEDKHLVIRSEYFFGYEEAHGRICSLLNVLQAADLDMIGKDDIYNVCTMINDLLPSHDEFHTLERLQKEEL